MPVVAGPSSHRIGGSFRDPAGYVFAKGDRIFRAIDEATSEDLRALGQSGVLARLIQSGAVVGTRVVDDPTLVAELRQEHAPFAAFLEHDRLDTLSFPYEWTVSMIADAGLATLEVQDQALSAAASLKDATAFNIQFVSGRPVFIDLGSFERPARLDVWFALGQFNQMFVFPLLLCVHHGWDPRAYFLPRLSGRTVEDVARTLGRLERWGPRALFDVTLPLALNKAAQKQLQVDRSLLDKPNPDTRPQKLQIERLRGKLRKLASSYRPAGTWSDYERTCTYTDSAEEAKKALVGRFLEARRPRRVLDLGCNTGDYSRIAAAAGAQVIAADGDHDAVEILYRRLRREPAAISPMVIDITNPSPAIGYLNQERPSFLERLDVDCVLGLALLHHLLISGNLSLAKTRDLFAALTRDLLVLEFVPTDDPMFRRMLQFRRDLFAGIDLAACKQVFAERFRLLEEHAIEGSPRTLLFYAKEGAT
jgi:SAM-dependent methyltransferase